MAEHNPVAHIQPPQAVRDAMDVVIEPITVAVEEVKKFVDTLKTFFDGLSFGRRLEELTPADMAHARGLKDQAHRQLEQVRGRLLHADNDNARDSTKERLQLDVYRRLETHLAKRKLAAARQLDAELVSISNLTLNSAELVSIKFLKFRISLDLDSRMLIEAHKDKYHLIPLTTEGRDFEKVVLLSPTPFTVKLAGSFKVEVSLQIAVVGDVKAEVHIVANGMGIEFDISSGARKFLKGDWTQTITLEVASVRCHTHTLPQALILGPWLHCTCSDGKFGKVLNVIGQCIRVYNNPQEVRVQADRPIVPIGPSPAENPGDDFHLDLPWHCLRRRPGQQSLGGGRGRRYGVDYHHRRGVRPGRGRERLPRVDV